MSRPDEGLIHQWLDGECTPEESARLEGLVASDPAWAAAVAEARGLLAASSRIVAALDAVPRATPHGATAGGKAPPPRGAARDRVRVTSWMGVAAGLVLVAGTAYVLREKSTAPFGVVTSAVDGSQLFDTAPGAQVGADPRQFAPPPEVPPVVADIAPAAPPPSPPPSPAGAPVALAIPAAPPPPAPIAERRAELSAARAASTRQATAAESRAGRALAMPPMPPMPQLEGCWRVTAPPELAGLLVAPAIRAAVADTLLVVTPRGDVMVVRRGDVLRGGLDAVAEPCPPE